MKIPSLVKQIQRFVDENAPAILTGIGIAGVGVTAVLTHKAATQSVLDIAYHETMNQTSTDGVDKLRLTWKNYVPAVAAGIGTAGCMFMATRINLQRLTTLGAVYAISEGNLKEHKAKVEELFGKKKATEVSDAVAKDQVEKTPLPQLVVGDGANEQIFFDRWSGRYFTSSRQKIDAAVNDLNHEMIYGSYVSLSSFYKLIGLVDTQEAHEIGWNKKQLIEISYTAMLKDDVPIIAIEFDKRPMPTFQDDDV